MSLSSLVDPNSPGSVFWGWSYGTASAPMSLCGTGTCYREAQAQHYIFWIGGDITTRYRYADCTTHRPIGDWVDSLMGLPTVE